MNKSTPNARLSSFEEMLETMGFIIYSCVGTSMLPLLRQHKDLVEIRALKGRAQKYDVVLYKRLNIYTLHRVLKVLPKGYIVAGDNNTFVETGITDKMILGKMVRVIRDGKSIYPSNLLYRIFVHVWCDVYPIRMFFLRVKSKIVSMIQ